MCVIVSLTTHEAQLCFKDPVQKFTVLTAVAVVCSLVGAHYTSSACFQTVHEGEDVELVDRAIVDIGAHGLTIGTRVATVLLKLCVSKLNIAAIVQAHKAYLFIEQPVLRLNNHALLLDTESNCFHAST